MSRPCPCGSTLPFAGCCEPLLTGERRAATAEQLMRSRYCAYATGNSDYLLDTWHPDTRPQHLALNAEPPTRWIGLEITSSVDGRETDRTGRVEFIARYKVNGRAGRLRENSRFVQEQGRWLYLDGKPD